MKCPFCEYEFRGDWHQHMYSRHHVKFRHRKDGDALCVCGARIPYDADFASRVAHWGSCPVMQIHVAQNAMEA